MTNHLHPRSTSRDIAQWAREAEGQHEWSSGPWRHPAPAPRRTHRVWWAVFCGTWALAGLAAALTF